jgi:hypothetical protein
VARTVTGPAVRWPDEEDSALDDAPDPDAAPPRPHRRAGWPAALILLALVGPPLAWVVVVLRTAEPVVITASAWAGAAQVPPGPAPAAGSPAVPRTGPARLTEWARRLGPLVGIPDDALAAYGSAELDLAASRPDCHLSWAALAGIGSVESDHGRLPEPIIGVPLDGRGVALIRDTDGGRLDGDPVYDRAVGAMQFLPTTWRRWGADGDGDGAADPFSLPDAALAAANYLCASGGGDLRQAAPWSRAVLAYNASGTYLAKVTATSQTYATRSLT